MLLTQNAIEFINDNLAIIAPLLIIQVVLMITALVSLIRAEATKGPKWMWALIILFINTIGPIAYFIFGRSQE
ncbi:MULTISPECIES: PLD nuclease N-terminal domain-containing protein [Halobacillus]|uniref:Negative regulatory protein YxlE n=1 Tax=Halobacillus faecis TaxID=360184 RepID=A0A511WTA3_9BACI|nr:MULTISPECIES: PLD nuclease N-terminal domain-containing protein [Halobacillus]MBX0359177.1 PLD nuclease N-terminal domain-containing protein [Halobacillus sp. Nhm2S1]GEN53483.1 negative regulatory protein YxlE [Halobacillus faecis]